MIQQRARHAGHPWQWEQPERRREQLEQREQERRQQEWERAWPALELFVRMYEDVVNSPTAECRAKLLIDAHVDRGAYMDEGVAVDVVMLPLYPALAMATVNVCGVGMTSMFWDEGPHEGLFVLTDAAAPGRRHSLEVYIHKSGDDSDEQTEQTDDNSGSGDSGDSGSGEQTDVGTTWIISVAASAAANNLTTRMFSQLLKLFKHLLWLRNGRNMFLGKLYYRHTVAVMEDRTRLVFGQEVADKCLLALMRSWLPVAGVIDE